MLDMILAGLSEALQLANLLFVLLGVIALSIYPIKAVRELEGGAQETRHETRNPGE